LAAAPEADLSLADVAVSRKHARLIISNGEARLTDLDSHNGTLVNNERIDFAPARDRGRHRHLLGPRSSCTAAARRRRRVSWSTAANCGLRLDEELERFAAAITRPLSGALIQLSERRRIVS